MYKFAMFHVDISSNWAVISASTVECSFTTVVHRLHCCVCKQHMGRRAIPILGYVPDHRTFAFFQWTLCIIGSHVFESCPPFWLCYQPWLLRTPSAALVQSDSEYRLFEIDFSIWVRVQTLWDRFLFLGWLKTCSRDLAKHARTFLLMAAGWAFFFFLVFLVSQASLLSLEG